MADNIDVSLKNLNQELKNMDKNLADLSNDFHNMFALAVKRATQDANVDIDTFFKELAKRTKASDANKLRLVYELVDENGRPLTPSELRKKVENLTNSIKNAKSSGQNNLLVGNTMMSLDNAIDQLERYKKQLKLVTDNVRLYDQAINISNKSVGVGGGNYAAALKKQETNALKLNRLLNDQKRLNNEVAQSGGRASKEQQQQQRLLNNEIKRTRTEMQNLERSYKGITAVAARNTMEQRMRRNKSTVDALNRSLKSTHKGLSDLMPMLYRLGSAFGVAFSVQGLVQFGKKLIETRGEFELQQVALRSILQNKELADEIWTKTMNQALQSPFTAMQLTRYTKQLAAYRIENEKLFDTTKMLADVSAGLGVDMQRLILAYGQVKAANYLRASEIRQFTEAGVNILGELAQYFSKTRGEMYSTAQVMDMVQKRMVKFGDVEEIFKRLTNEGGIFYNMQYVQSQTVKGQIAKLHDAYDQMLNSIGKSNEGTIKKFIAALNSLVQNWRNMATVIKSIAWATAIGWLSKYATAILGIGKASMTTKRGLVSMKLAVEGLGKAIKTNWITLAIAAATYAITSMIESARDIKQINEEIDEQITNLYNTSERIKGYQSSIEENNKTIKENSKDTSDNTEKQKKLQDALDGNRSILSKLQSDYPQLAAGLKLNTDGTIDITKALEDYNKQLEREMQLLALKEGEGSGFAWGWFSDVAEEDMSDAVKDLTNVQTLIRNLQLRLKTELAKAEIKGTADEEQKELARRFLAIPTEGDMEDAVNQALALQKEYVDKYVSSLAVDAGGAVYTDKINTGVFKTFYENWALYDEILKHTTDELESELKQIGWLGSDGELGKLELDFITDLETFEQFAKQISDEYSGDVAKFIANNSKQIQDAVEGNVEKGIAAMPEIVKSIGTSLKSAGKATTPEMRALYNRILNDRLVFTEENERLNEIDAQIAAEKAKKVKNQNQQLLDDLAAQRRKFIKENSIDFFADVPLDTKTTDDDDEKPKEGNKKQLDSISRLISLLKEMNSEYDKLSKSAYGYARSQDKVRESFDKSFEAIFKVKGGAGTYIDYSKTDFTSKRGLANALQALYDSMKEKDAFKKFAKGTEEELLKAISQALAEVDIELSVKFREDTAKELEKMLNDIDATIEMQGLGLSEKDAQELLGLDYTSLNQLFERVKKFRADLEDQLVDEIDDKGQKTGNKAKKTYLDKDDQKMYEDWMKKVEDKIYKMRVDRAKQYSKFLETELSERAKLEMQYAQDVAFIDTYFKGEQQRAIKQNLTKKFEDEIHELEWKTFKESDFYVEMMQDLTSMPTEYLDLMMKKLDEWTKKADVLSPRALKEVLKAIEKVMEAQVAMSPMRAMNQSLDRIGEFQKSGRKDVRGEDISKTVRGSRKQLQEIMALRADEIMKQQSALALEEEKLGKLKAQQEIQETLNQLTNKGIEGLKMTANAEADIANINARILAKESEKNQLAVPTQNEGELDGAFADRKQKYENEKREIEDTIELLKILIGVRRNAENVGLKDPNADMGASVAGTFKNVSDLKDKIKDLEKAQASDADIDEAYKQWVKAYHGLFQNINEVRGTVKALGTQFYETMKIASEETDIVSDAWMEFGSQVSDVITKALEMIPSLVTGFTAAGVAINSAMGIIGLIATAIQLVLTLISGLSKIHDTKLERDIQNQQIAIDNLARAYERLEKQIDRTLHVSDYMRTYDDSIDNIRERIQATEQQLQAERNKKDSDEDKIQEYENNIEDLYDKEHELREKMIEDMGGIGEDNYRSWAEGFVSAWKDAFLETGDGLDALQEHFDEFLQDWFVKQATMRIAGKALERVMGDIDNVVSDDGYVNWDELQRIRQQMALVLPELNERLSEFAGMWDLGGEGALSGLAAGIQGITEEQANILEAYWNSVRLYTASIDANVAAIATAFGVGTGVNTNPMLQQLTLTAQHTNDILLLLESVRTNNGSGNGIRVYSV